MSYDEEQARRSRVVVDTPGERREVVHSQTVRGEDRSGVSAGMVGVLVVVAIALITMLVLFWMSTQPTTETATTATQPPTIVEQPAPAQQPPVIIQQPAPVTTQPAPVIVTPPAGGSTASDSAAALNIDSKIQTEVDKRLTEDSTFSSLGITATVLDGKVTLLGTVKSETLKADVERMVRQIKGVKSIDNQITVM